MSIRNTKQAKRLIEAMAPEGEFLAFINEKEAQMLRDAGGSGIMTLAGIPSFVSFSDSSQGISAADTFSSAGSGGFSGGDDGGGGDQEDDNARMMQAMGLTRGPTITTGEDQEDDNARMMQALGIPPGVTYSGTNTFIDPFPDRGISVKNILTNAALAKLAKTNPKAYAALQVGGALKEVLSAFRDPNLDLNLTKMEERELATLKTGKEVGLNTPAQNQRLEELEQKKAEEEQK